MKGTHSPPLLISNTRTMAAPLNEQNRETWTQRTAERKEKKCYSLVFVNLRIIWKENLGVTLKYSLRCMNKVSEVLGSNYSLFTFLSLLKYHRHHQPLLVHCNIKAFRNAFHRPTANGISTNSTINFSSKSSTAFALPAPPSPPFSPSPPPPASNNELFTSSVAAFIPCLRRTASPVTLRR